MMFQNEEERERYEREQSDLLRAHLPTKSRRIETRSMQELREARGNRCRRCRSRSKLEFAHVKETKVSGRGRGQMVRYCDIKRNPDAYELLCWDCHHEFDRQGGYRVFYGLLLVEFLEGDRRPETEDRERRIA